MNFTGTSWRDPRDQCSCVYTPKEILATLRLYYHETDIGKIKIEVEEYFAKKPHHEGITFYKEFKINKGGIVNKNRIKMRLGDWADVIEMVKYDQDPTICCMLALDERHPCHPIDWDVLIQLEAKRYLITYLVLEAKLSLNVLNNDLFYYM